MSASLFPCLVRTALCASIGLAASARAETVFIENPGFESVSRPLADGEQTNGLGGVGTLLGTREPFPFGSGIVDWSSPVTVPGWRTFTVPFGSPNIVYAGALRPADIGGTPFVTGIQGDHVLAIQVTQVGQETGTVLQPNTTYTLGFLGAVSQFDSSYFFAVSLTAIDDTATLPVENQPGVTRLALGTFSPPGQQPDGIMRRYEFSYTSPAQLPAELVGTRLGINLFGSDGLPRVLYDDFTLTAIAGAAPSFCDATDGALASCPCANPGEPETGCDVAQATGGVALRAVCQETSPANRITWQGTGFAPAGSPASIVLRSTGLDSASPVVFGDGLRCIGAPLVRLAATFASGGSVTHTHGHGAMAGSGDFYYQLWFRNTPAMYCTPAAFNLSNGRVVTW